MSVYARAAQIYSDGRRVIDATRDLAVVNDSLRWAREDLEDVLLDLKLAVMDADTEALETHLQEALQLYADIDRMLDA